MVFSEKLKNARLAAGMTQDELSKIVRVSRSTIGMYESGKREPDFETLEKICDALHVTVGRMMEDASLLELVAADNGLRDAIVLIRSGKKADLSEAKQRLIDSVYAMSDEQVSALQSVVDQILKERK